MCSLLWLMVFYFLGCPQCLADLHGNEQTTVIFCYYRLHYPKLKKTLRGKHFATIEEASTEVIGQLNNEGVLSGIQDMLKPWEAVIRRNGDCTEGL